MTTCKQCRKFEKCKDDAFINGAKFDPKESAKYCTDFEPITNADRIRAMSDEELVEFIKNIKVRAVLCKAVKNNDAFDELCSAEWLKRPTE